jgi:SSS family solute:Na+ symporter
VSALLSGIIIDRIGAKKSVFLFGVFWRRGTKQAALAALWLGFLIGMGSFVLDLPVFGSEKLITQSWGVSFMMQAWWSFCVCSVFYVIVSLLTPPPEQEKVAGLTWDHPLEAIVHSWPKRL